MRFVARLLVFAAALLVAGQVYAAKQDFTLVNRTVYNDGEKTYWENLDLCSISRIQLYWDRKAGTTHAITD